MDKIKLSEWARKNDISYMSAYRKFNSGQIKNAYKDGKGIFVHVPIQQTSAAISNLPKVRINPVQSNTSLASFTDSTGLKVRRNRISTGEETFDSRFPNIDGGLTPFTASGAYGTNSSGITVKDTVELCQKAYYNFAIFRNVIDLMTEFSVSKIDLVGGTKRSRNFFEAYLEKINLMDLQDMFFREYYRSGNVFLWKFMGEASVLLRNAEIPVRFIILNPADIILQDNSSFSSAGFRKVLNPYEIERLINPKTEEDKQIKEDLSDKLINLNTLTPGVKNVAIELDQERMRAVFYKKQSYEPFAVPMGFPVLDDIEWKQELKKLDKFTSRTIHQAILLVTMGAKPEDGGVDQQNLLAMQELFDNESVGRVIISDYTTKAEWVIPNIGSILDPKKYEVVDRDIREGLNNVLFSGGEKFANQESKIQVFLERLKQAREKFLDEFLIPEMEEIGSKLNFRSIPVPKFQDLDFKDPVQEKRVITRLIELGILTADEGIRAIETGRLPTPEESKENQEAYVKERQDKNYYFPLISGNALNNVEESGPVKNAPKESGRPPGSSTAFDLNKIQENILKANGTLSEVKKAIRKKYKVKRLNEQQENAAREIVSFIVSDNDPEEWIKVVESYVKEPSIKNEDRYCKVEKIAEQYQTSEYLSAILLASQREIKDE